jgi:4-carboxymuconolactone decarboxylase
VSRLSDLPPERMTPEQRAQFERGGGRTLGPTGIWWRTPALAGPAGALANVLRNGTLEPRLFELMCLIVARIWSAQYVFTVHAPLAREAGLDPAIIEAIRLRRLPPFTRDDERIVYEFVTELQQTRALSQSTYERIVGLLGEEKTIELVTAIGLYAAIGGLLNTFDATAPDAPPLP